MTTLIKTQCPNCQIYFDLPAELPELLHRPNTQMRCAHCRHSFLINENLVVSAHDDLKGSKPRSDNNKSSDSKKFLDNTKHLDNTWLEKLLNEHHGDKKYSHAQTKASDASLDKHADGSSTVATSTKPQTSTPSKTDTLLDRDFSDQSSYQNNSIINKEQRLRQHDDEPQSVAMLLWTAGCLVLILSLFAQYIIFNLNTLIKNPDYAARLEAVCSVAACSLPSADLEAFVISDLNFRASKIESADTFSDVQATLVNQSTQIQLLPSLKVSIYGSEALIGEFLAMPKDYLIGRQSQMSASYGKPFMFTIPVTSKQISKIIIEPIY